MKNEIDRALNDHELIKIRIAGQDRDVRRAMVMEICEALQAESAQVIGNIAVLYRKKIESV